MHVAWSAILRRLSQNGHSGVYIVVQVPGLKGTPDELLMDVQDASDRANEMLDRDGEVLVWSQGATPSVKGPMVQLDWVGTDAQTEEWLDTFAEVLTERGWAGQVTAAPQARFPKGFNEYTYQPRLTSFLALTLQDAGAYYAPDGGWHVGQELTAGLCRFAVDWAALPGAATYLSESTSDVLMGDPRPAQALTTAVTRSALAGVISLLTKPYRSRSVAFRSEGRVGFQAGADGSSMTAVAWREHAEAVTATLLHLPDKLDYGVIRPAVGFGSERASFTKPPVRDALYDTNQHLWSRKVQDAHGCQLLTGQHLDQARDLSAWTVTQVAADRFLVQAPDLAPWWDTFTPDPDVLAQARSDFGDMIMTIADIEADPDGWLPGRERTIE